MTIQNQTKPTVAAGMVPEEDPGAGPAAVSVLDQTLWRRFAKWDSFDEFVATWLALQCRMLGAGVRGVVVLRDSEEEEFSPAATWPEDTILTAPLMRAAERALGERRGVVLRSGAAGAVALGYPVTIDGRVHGAAVLEITAADEAQQRRFLRQLQWGVGSLVAALRHEEEQDRAAAIDRTALIMDLVADALEQDRFAAACNGVVTELALRLNCDVAAIGFSRARRVKVASLSHASQFGWQMNLIRGIERLMDEALDQRSVVLFPPDEGWEFRIDREHAEVSGSHNGACLLTVPIHARGAFVGALHLQRPHERPFSENDVRVCDCVAAIVGPILYDKKRDERTIFRKIASSVAVQLGRLVGPGYIGRKVAAIVLLAVIAFLATATGQYRVTSPATLYGSVERAVIAPMDGYIFDQHVRAGEVIGAGDVMAQMDDREMVIERLRWETERNAKLTAYDQALAEHERADANVIRSEIEQAEAQIELLDIQIERAALRAPFEGIVLSGDLSQHVGGAVKRGDELFRISPLASYRLHLEVDERDIAEVNPGQQGLLILSSLPEDTHPFTVRNVTPVSESRDGRTYFRVEAELEDANPRLRPGMGGIAKTEVDERLLVLIWTDRLIDWARIFFWKWLP